MPNWITALEEELNKKLLVVLRDGRKFIGVLRTFDQFGNLLLEDTYERLMPEKGEIFSDVYAGCILIRGDNMLLFGDVDESKSVPLRKAPLHEVLASLQQVNSNTRSSPFFFSLLCSSLDLSSFSLTHGLRSSLLVSLLPCSSLF